MTQDQHRRRRRRRVTIAAAAAISTLAALAAAPTPASAFTCPSATMVPAPRTLSMNCLGACSDAYSPCLFYANTTTCSGLQSKPQYGDSGTSVCVPSADGACAVECLAPFSGRSNESWNLQLTTTGSGLVDDKRERRAEDPFFRVVTRPVAWLSKITDVAFPPTTTQVVISGEALPVRDKLTTYTFIDKGSVVYAAIQVVDIFRNARNLSSLMIENIDLYGLATFPATLSKLETLVLSNNRLEFVPNGVGALATIKMLDLSQNLFKKVSEEDIPKSVEDLNLQLCSLFELPSVVTKLPKLKKLDVSGNMFPAPAANTLPLQLEILSLAYLTLRTLPPDVRSMRALKYLDLEWNEFRDGDLTQLPPSLEVLRLGYSQLPALPDDLASLTSLTRLDVSENTITTIQAHGLPPNLKSLNLSTNALATLRADVLPLSLEMLDLSANKLEALPDGFHKLEALTELHLNDSAFTAFPAVVFELPALQVLAIDSPKLQDVTFTREQAHKLAALRNFTINADALLTGCAAASAVRVHRYTICISARGTSSLRGNGGASMARETTYLLIGAGAVAVGLIVVALVWRRRRVQRKLRAFQVGGGGGGSGLRRSLSDKKMFCLDDLDSDMILESPSHEHQNGGGDFLTSSAKFSSHTTMSASSSSKGSRRFLSVWDDEELLKWRVDANEVHDLERLNTGYYGEVWLATYLSKLVAVKRLKRGRRADQVARTEIQQFIAEIRLLARFDHPKIVAFIGVAWTMESDIQALVEYMPRGDLCAYIAAANAATAEPRAVGSRTTHWDDSALRIAMDIVEAIVYLHSLSPAVLHRDLKSRNVLLHDDLSAKLTDFGGSRSQSEDETTTRTNGGVGTARWTAPEVLNGTHHSASEAVDMYAFGVILSELETYEIPYAERTGVSEACLLSRIAAGELQPMFTATAPVEIVALARQCLAFEPTARPSAVQVAYILRQIAVATNSRYRRVTEPCGSPVTSSPSDVGVL